MNKVALFDFCETIANFQTADAYVDFVRERLNDKRMCKLERIQNRLRKYKIIQFFDKITKYKYSINKRIKLWQLKGCSVVELQNLAKDYYKERIKPNFIPELIDKLNELKESRYNIFLVSGGYDIYLHFFAEEYALSGVISTKIGFKDSICTGRIDGIDCLREGKTQLLDHYFIIKPDYSLAFSDSITDLPLLKWVDEGYVISRQKHQKWSTNNNLKELIWIPKK